MQNANLERVGLREVDRPGEHERNEDVEYLGGDVTQRQIADEHFVTPP